MYKPSKIILSSALFLLSAINSSVTLASGYPTFTEQEIQSGFSIVSVNDSEYVIEENESEEEASSENEGNEKLEYVHETARLYQHLPENPVYTYGKDTDERGACVGTEEFCAKSELIWKNFEERAEAGQLIVGVEGEDAGKIVMPEAYAQSVSEQPQIRGEEASKCPEGYDYYPDGNEYRNFPHCGKLEGSYYYVSYPK